MDERKIEFRQVRDFGENLGDIFQFMRQEGKAFFKSFFAICGVFMLLTIVVTGIFQSNVFSFIPRPGSVIYENPFGKIFTGTFFLALLSGYLTQISLPTCIFAYVRAYVENGNQSPDIQQVWSLFRKYFFKTLILIIPVFLLTIIGFLFCILPGVYLGVVFAPFIMVLIYENSNFGGAFDRCFTLIKENFWFSFGIYLVAGFIYLVAQMLIGIVITIATSFVALTTSTDLVTGVSILTSFLSAFNYCFYVIPLLAVAFNYFTLAEKKDGTGILSRIANLGQVKINPDSSEEEY